MAYMSQERKKALVAKAKPILSKYGVKATFAVRNHSTLVCNIKSSHIDFMGGDLVWKKSSLTSEYMDVNPYHYENQFQGRALAFLKELIPVMNDGNYDKSDIMTDYFNVGWYIDINIGEWKKPYVLLG